MKRYLVILAVSLSILIGGCGGGTDNNSTTPTKSKVKLYYDSDTFKYAKVALITTDPDNNWVTVSSSSTISNNSQGWGWGDFSINLPIVSNDAVYGYMPYNDKNNNFAFDEGDNENMQEYIDWFAVYRAQTREWTVVDYNGKKWGTLPQYLLKIDTSLSSSQSLLFNQPQPINVSKLKQAVQTMKKKLNIK